MYKFFWKFFFVIWFAQLTTIWGIGTAIWYFRHHEPLSQINLDLSNGASFYLDPVVDTLKKEGVEATEDYLKKRFRRIVYVVDLVNNKELLNRNIPSDFLDLVNQKNKITANNHAIQKISIGTHEYLLFVVDVPSPWRNGPFFPVVPITGATIASLLFAFLLARHLARPIQLIKNSVTEVGEGNFNIHLNQDLVNRHDSLGELASDIQKMSMRLGNLIDSQQKLLHTISHELRSPLTRLQMATGLLRQTLPNDNEEMLRIERECKRMDILIGELLTLSKLDAGISQTHLEKIDLKPLLQEIIDNAQFEAHSLKKEVIFTNPKSFYVLGDASLLFSAIENVVRNALKYARSKVTITIDTLENKMIVISIVDDGEGVLENELQLLTNPFYRASNTLKTNKNNGFGLGLAITNKILEAHNGYLRFSNLGDKQGFKVDLLLP